MDELIKDKYFIGMYWGARKENIKVCTDKLYATFSCLSRADLSLQNWFRTQKPKKGQMVMPIGLTKADLESLLEKSQSFNDDGTFNDDLGYLLYLKSDKNFSTSHIFSITCGSYNNQIPNCVTIEIGKNDGYKHLTKEDTLNSIYSQLVEIWKPETGVIKRNDEVLLTETYSASLQ